MSGHFIWNLSNMSSVFLCVLEQPLCEVKNKHKISLALFIRLEY